MFDDALLESRKSRSLGARRLSLPVAVGLHLAVIGAFVGASTWFPGEAPEPPIPVVFPTASAPAGPPPPPGGHEAVWTPRGRRPRPVPAMTQPTEAPGERPEDVIQTAGASETETAISDSRDPGSPYGAPEGTGDSRQVGTAVVEEPIPIGGDVRAPVLRWRVTPEYPESARRAHLQGTVILEAVITTSGAVQQIRVLKSVNPLLDEAAERAVRQWRYEPATLNGRVVPVYLNVTVTFGIDG